jgi:hypothetical protein
LIQGELRQLGIHIEKKKLNNNSFWHKKKKRTAGKHITHLDQA